MSSSNQPQNASKKNSAAVFARKERKPEQNHGQYQQGYPDSTPNQHFTQHYANYPPPNQQYNSIQPTASQQPQPTQSPHQYSPHHHQPHQHQHQHQQQQQQQQQQPQSPYSSHSPHNQQQYHSHQQPQQPQQHQQYHQQQQSQPQPTQQPPQPTQQQLQQQHQQYLYQQAAYFQQLTPEQQQHYQLQQQQIVKYMADLTPDQQYHYQQQLYQYQHQAYLHLQQQQQQQQQFQLQQQPQYQQQSIQQAQSQGLNLTNNQSTPASISPYTNSTSVQTPVQSVNQIPVQSQPLPRSTSTHPTQNDSQHNVQQQEQTQPQQEQEIQPSTTPSPSQLFTNPTKQAQTQTQPTTSTTTATTTTPTPTPTFDFDPVVSETITKLITRLQNMPTMKEMTKAQTSEQRTLVSQICGLLLISPLTLVEFASLSADLRAFIHTRCRQFNLNSTSKGSREKRVLTVSKNQPYSQYYVPKIEKLLSSRSVNLSEVFPRWSAAFAFYRSYHNPSNSSKLTAQQQSNSSGKGGTATNISAIPAAQAPIQSFSNTTASNASRFLNPYDDPKATEQEVKATGVKGVIDMTFSDGANQQLSKLLLFYHKHLNFPLYTTDSELSNTDTTTTTAVDVISADIAANTASSATSIDNGSSDTSDVGEPTSCSEDEEPDPSLDVDEYCEHEAVRVEAMYRVTGMKDLISSEFTDYNTTFIPDLKQLHEAQIELNTMKLTTLGDQQNDLRFEIRQKNTELTKLEAQMAENVKNVETETRQALIRGRYLKPAPVNVKETDQKEQLETELKIAQNELIALDNDVKHTIGMIGHHHKEKVNGEDISVLTSQFFSTPHHCPSHCPVHVHVHDHSPTSDSRTLVNQNDHSDSNSFESQAHQPLRRFTCYRKFCNQQTLEWEPGSKALASDASLVAHGPKNLKLLLQDIEHAQSNPFAAASNKSIESQLAAVTKDIEAMKAAKAHRPPTQPQKDRFVRLQKKHTKLLSKTTKQGKNFDGIHKIPEVASILNLPVRTQSDRVLHALHHNQTIILVGQTGSGKSTQIPQIIFEHFHQCETCLAAHGGYGKHFDAKILCTQPRRLAAISLAQRVADERGELIKRGDEKQKAAQHLQQFQSSVKSGAAGSELIDTSIGHDDGSEEYSQTIVKFGQDQGDEEGLDLYHDDSEDEPDAGDFNNHFDGDHGDDGDGDGNDDDVEIELLSDVELDENDTDDKIPVRNTNTSSSSPSSCSSHSTSNPEKEKYSIKKTSAIGFSVKGLSVNPHAPIVYATSGLFLRRLTTEPPQFASNLPPGQRPLPALNSLSHFNPLYSRWMQCHEYVTKLAKASPTSDTAATKKKRSSHLSLNALTKHNELATMIFKSVFSPFVHRLLFALRKYTHILIDEAHERDKLTDFILVLLKVALFVRRDLKVIVMSATINAQLFSEYFNNAPIINIEGRTFPVSTSYLHNSMFLAEHAFTTGAAFKEDACVSSNALTQLPSSTSSRPGRPPINQTSFKNIYNVFESGKGVSGLDAAKYLQYQSVLAAAQKYISQCLGINAPSETDSTMDSKDAPTDKVDKSNDTKNVKNTKGQKGEKGEKSQHMYFSPEFLQYFYCGNGNSYSIEQLYRNVETTPPADIGNKLQNVQPGWVPKETCGCLCPCYTAVFPLSTCVNVLLNIYAPPKAVMSASPYTNQHSKSSKPKQATFSSHMDLYDSDSDDEQTNHLANLLTKKPTQGTNNSLAVPFNIENLKPKQAGGRIVDNLRVVEGLLGYITNRSIDGAVLDTCLQSIIFGGNDLLEDVPGSDSDDGDDDEDDDDEAKIDRQSATIDNLDGATGSFDELCDLLDELNIESETSIITPKQQTPTLSTAVTPVTTPATQPIKPLIAPTTTMTTNTAGSAIIPTNQLITSKPIIKSGLIVKPPVLVPAKQQLSSLTSLTKPAGQLAQIKKEEQKVTKTWGNTPNSTTPSTPSTTPAAQSTFSSSSSRDDLKTAQSTRYAQNANTMANIFNTPREQLPYGAILIFVAGWTDIVTLTEALLKHPVFGTDRYSILPLHSTVPLDQQQLAFEIPTITMSDGQVYDNDAIKQHYNDYKHALKASSGDEAGKKNGKNNNQKALVAAPKRKSKPTQATWKIIISTNIAETSVTIPDAVYVIDFITHKEKIYNPTADFSTFSSCYIAQSNSNQRSGRAGRVRPGYCFRLCDLPMFNWLPQFPKPEVLTSSIEDLVLSTSLLTLDNDSSIGSGKEKSKVRITPRFLEQHRKYITALSTYHARQIELFGTASVDAIATVKRREHKQYTKEERRAYYRAQLKKQQDLKLAEYKRFRCVRFLSLMPQPPQLSSIVKAIHSLQSVSALDSYEHPSPLAHIYSTLPLPPRLSRLLILSLFFGCFDHGLTAVAVLTSPPVFPGKPQPPFVSLPGGKSHDGPSKMGVIEPLKYNSDGVLLSVFDLLKEAQTSTADNDPNSQTTPSTSSSDTDLTCTVSSGTIRECLTNSTGSDVVASMHAFYAWLSAGVAYTDRRVWSRTAGIAHSACIAIATTRKQLFNVLNGSPFRQYIQQTFVGQEYYTTLALCGKGAFPTHLAPGLPQRGTIVSMDWISKMIISIPKLDASGNLQVEVIPHRFGSNQLFPPNSYNPPYYQASKKLIDELPHFMLQYSRTTNNKSFPAAVKSFDSLHFRIPFYLHATAGGERAEIMADEDGRQQTLLEKTLKSELSSHNFPSRRSNFSHSRGYDPVPPPRSKKYQPLCMVNSSNLTLLTSLLGVGTSLAVRDTYNLTAGPFKAKSALKNPFSLNQVHFPPTPPKITRESKSDPFVTTALHLTPAILGYKQRVTLHDDIQANPHSYDSQPLHYIDHPYQSVLADFSKPMSRFSAQINDVVTLNGTVAPLRGIIPSALKQEAMLFDRMDNLGSMHLLSQDMLDFNQLDRKVNLPYITPYTPTAMMRYGLLPLVSYNECIVTGADGAKNSTKLVDCTPTHPSSLLFIAPTLGTIKHNFNTIYANDYNSILHLTNYYYQDQLFNTYRYFFAQSNPFINTAISKFDHSLVSTTNTSLYPNGIIKYDPTGKKTDKFAYLHTPTLSTMFTGDAGLSTHVVSLQCNDNDDFSATDSSTTTSTATTATTATTTTTTTTRTPILSKGDAIIAGYRKQLDLLYSYQHRLHNYIRFNEVNANTTGPQTRTVREDGSVVLPHVSTMISKSCAASSTQRMQPLQSFIHSLFTPQVEQDKDRIDLMMNMTSVDSNPSFTHTDNPVQIHAINKSVHDSLIWLIIALLYRLCTSKNTTLSKSTAQRAPKGNTIDNDDTFSTDSDEDQGEVVVPDITTKRIFIQAPTICSILVPTISLHCDWLDRDGTVISSHPKSRTKAKVENQHGVEVEVEEEVVQVDPDFRPENVQITLTFRVNLDRSPIFAMLRAKDAENNPEGTRSHYRRRYETNLTNMSPWITTSAILAVPSSFFDFETQRFTLSLSNMFQLIQSLFVSFLYSKRFSTAYQLPMIVTQNLVGLFSQNQAYIYNMLQYNIATLLQQSIVNASIQTSSNNNIPTFHASTPSTSTPVDLQNDTVQPEVAVLTKATVTETHQHWNHYLLTQLASGVATSAEVDIVHNSYYHHVQSVYQSTNNTYPLPPPLSTLLNKNSTEKEYTKHVYSEVRDLLMFERDRFQQKPALYPLLITPDHDHPPQALVDLDARIVEAATAKVPSKGKRGQQGGKDAKPSRESSKKSVMDYIKSHSGLSAEGMTWGDYIDARCGTWTPHYAHTAQLNEQHLKQQVPLYFLGYLYEGTNNALEHHQAELDSQPAKKPQARKQKQPEQPKQQSDKSQQADAKKNTTAQPAVVEPVPETVVASEQLPSKPTKAQTKAVKAPQADKSQPKAPKSNQKTQKFIQQPELEGDAKSAQPADAPKFITFSDPDLGDILVPIEKKPDPAPPSPIQEPIQSERERVSPLQTSNRAELESTVTKIGTDSTVIIPTSTPPPTQATNKKQNPKPNAKPKGNPKQPPSTSVSAVITIPEANEVGSDTASISIPIPVTTNPPPRQKQSIKAGGKKDGIVTNNSVSSPVLADKSATPPQTAKPKPQREPKVKKTAQIAASPQPQPQPQPQSQPQP